MTLTINKLATHKFLPPSSISFLKPKSNNSSSKIPHFATRITLILKTIIHLIEKYDGYSACRTKSTFLSIAEKTFYSMSLYYFLVSILNALYYKPCTTPQQCLTSPPPFLCVFATLTICPGSRALGHKV